MNWKKNVDTSGKSRVYTQIRVYAQIREEVYSYRYEYYVDAPKSHTEIHTDRLI